MTTALISNLQKYSVHDGPGIRTTVFFKGCPLLCAWCHNPETQIFQPEIIWQAEKCIGCGSCLDVCPQQAISRGEQGDIILDREKCDRCHACAAACPTLAMERLGEEMTLEQVLAQIDQDAPFYEQSHGGVTLSGGEPLSQAEFACDLLRACHSRGYHTAVDTSGFVPLAVLQQAQPHTDLFLYDIKQLDSALHEKYTRTPNEPILRNLRWLAQQDTPVWLRVPVIPSINDSPEHIRAIGELAVELKLKEIYLLPYHKMAAAKYQRLHLPYTLSALDDLHEEDMSYATDILRQQGLNVHIGG